MSQQDVQRRSNIGGPSRSQLPMPASAMRPMGPPAAPAMRNSTMRMSMAGPPQRVLAAPPSVLVPPSTNPRQSMMRSNNAPASSVKRNAPPGKDQRDTRSGAFKSAVLHAVIDFLQAIDYPGDLSLKTLTSPPAREVHSIVKAMYGWLDPNHTWGRGGVRFEDEFLGVLKGMRYPYADTLTKATLQTPGSMPNMPHILGMLDWLVNTCKVRLPSARVYLFTHSKPGSSRLLGEPRRNPVDR